MSRGTGAGTRNNALGQYRVICLSLSITKIVIKTFI